MIPPQQPEREKHCGTCAIPWELSHMRSALCGKNYHQKYPDCPLQGFKDVIGRAAIEKITEKISCSHWVQTLCSRCGKPLEREACGYCGNPYCVDCIRIEEALDEQD